MSLSNPTKFAWKTELKTLDQNPPILNTLHEVFHETGGCKLIFLLVQQDNTPVGAEEIDVVITRDGTTLLFDSSVVNVLNSGTSYNVTMGFQSALILTETQIMDMQAAHYPLYMRDVNAPFSGHDEMHGHDLKVEVRQTSAIAAGARIRVSALIEVLENL